MRERENEREREMCEGKEKSLLKGRSKSRLYLD